MLWWRTLELIGEFCHKYSLSLMVLYGEVNILSLEFDIVSEKVIGDHCYYAWVVKGDWQQAIANEYGKLRTDTRFPIEPICLDGLEFSIDTIKERIFHNTIPERRGGNFDVVRSDFGEVISYMTLEQKYSTQFGYKSIRDRELVQLPGRGIDGIGIETGEKLRLVLTETKVSSQRTSPPSVVDSSEDSMRNQHLDHISKPETCKKIWDVARRTTSSELQKLFMTAALMFEYKMFDRLELITCCVLVRPKMVHTCNDFGSFMSHAKDFLPGKIRFLVICIPEENGNNLEEIIDEWFKVLNERRCD
ncbi:hypothetical protein [Brevibacillus sp. NL20B1]|uniref:hypothetical protein n=1 Tax=Brevibacillus sp. NL20B1 TaxID=2829799 RepID=UPI000471FE38|nr:hypothetical protein [Brevibacillus sp. NL20B1]